VIVMFPYYGARRPAGQFAHILPDVAAFFTQVSAALMESAAVAAWAVHTYPVRPAPSLHQWERAG